MELNFCRRCGSKLTQINDHTFECAEHHIIFANPAPTVGIFLFKKSGELLLSIRGRDPGKGLLDCFGGFLDGAETFEEALVREMREELDLRPSEYSTPEYLISSSGTYTFNAETTTVVSNFYKATLLTDKELVPHDDVADIHVTTLTEVDMTLIAGKDVQGGILHLKKFLD